MLCHSEPKTCPSTWWTPVEECRAEAACAAIHAIEGHHRIIRSMEVHDRCATPRGKRTPPHPTGEPLEVLGRAETCASVPAGKRQHLDSRSARGTVRPRYGLCPARIYRARL